MDAGTFRAYVKLVEECMYHNLDGRAKCMERMETTFDYFGVPVEWREPIRVMAEGWSYYSADKWYNEG